MLLKVKRLVAFVAATGLSLGIVSCADDEETPEPVQEAAPAEEPAAPPPVEEPQTVSEPATFTPDTVYFAFDDYSVSAEGQGSLNALAEKLKESAASTVQVEGHADARGSTEYNLALGDRRAQSVKQYLVNSGVDGGRLTTISYGEERPAAEGNDEAAWSKNRRVEFVITNK